MAWIERENYYEWDVSDPTWPQAVVRSQKLSEQYTIFTDVVPTDEGTFVVITQNTITEEHSIACRCEKCLVL